jgi:hypothetical protein
VERAGKVASHTTKRAEAAVDGSKSVAVGAAGKAQHATTATASTSKQVAAESAGTAVLAAGDTASNARSTDLAASQALDGAASAQASPRQAEASGNITHDSTVTSSTPRLGGSAQASGRHDVAVSTARD